MSLGSDLSTTTPNVPIRYTSPIPTNVTLWWNESSTTEGTFVNESNYFFRLNGKDTLSPTTLGCHTANFAITRTSTKIYARIISLVSSLPSIFRGFKKGEETTVTPYVGYDTPYIGRQHFPGFYPSGIETRLSVVVGTISCSKRTRRQPLDLCVCCNCNL